MENRDIALDYIQCFCSADMQGLEKLLASDLKFVGPFHTYSSSAQYLADLRNDPPEHSSYNILSITESPESVAVFYEYIKPTQTMLIAQLFKFENQKIKEIMLVFDSNVSAS